MRRLPLPAARRPAALCCIALALAVSLSACGGNSRPAAPGDGPGAADLPPADARVADDGAVAAPEVAGADACAADACGTACIPGRTKCVDATARRACLDDGTWSDPIPCAAGEVCKGVTCIDACKSDPGFMNSSYGCEYWSVGLEMGTSTMPGETPPADVPHSVALSNPGDIAATVTFSTLSTTIALPWTKEVIAPHETREFVMPRGMDMIGSGIFDKAVHIVSDQPLVAVQFNTHAAANAFSCDSSLLLPYNILGTDYLDLGWPGGMATGFDPTMFTEIAIVATAPGMTTVTVTPTRECIAVAPGTTPLPANQPATFLLGQHQTLQIEANSKTFSMEGDLTGSTVTANQRVAVFTGHEGALICPDAARRQLCPDVSSSGCNCCLNHMEEQLWPIGLLVQEYLVVKMKPRGTVDLDTIRVQAVQAGVTLATDPPIAGLDGKTLGRPGSFVQAATDQSFRLTATGPVQVAQYLSANACVTDQTGDSSQVLGVGINQYRDNYPLLVPQGFEHNWLTVTRPQGSTTTLDGLPVTVTATAIGSSGWECAYVEVSEGPHEVDGSERFGLTQYGYLAATSYANPVGFDLAK